MPYMQAALNDVKEPQLVPDGTYNVECVNVEHGETKAGDREIYKVLCRVTDDVEGVDNISPIMLFLLVPNDADRSGNNMPKITPDIVNNWFLEIKRAAVAFGLEIDDTGGVNLDDLAGRSATVAITTDTGDDKVTRNRIVLPRLDA